jgi:hypothetical protein
MAYAMLCSIHYTKYKKNVHKVLLINKKYYSVLGLIAQRMQLSMQLTAFMKRKLLVLLISFLSASVVGYSQDSARTKNDKPGTTQSLKTSDQSPQSHADIINSNTAPNQTIVHGAPESNKVNSGKRKTIITNSAASDKPVPTTPITIINKPPGRPASTVNSSAIQNGISNSSNPIRKN